MAREGKPRLELKDGKVTYSGEGNQWEVAVADLRVIGEYTTPLGPLTEDYFVVFLAGPDRIFHAPVSSQGCDVVLAELSKDLGEGEIQFGLANITELESRVMWPTALIDKKLFEYREAARAGIPSWLTGLGFPGPVEGELLPEVRAYLA